MSTISVKLSAPLDAKLTALAARRRTSRAEVVRQVLAAYEDSQPPTFLELIGDLIGCVDGPGDLSANPKYMEGFGE